MGTVVRLRGCTVDLVAGTVMRGGAVWARLTTREGELLKYLAASAGRSVPVRELEREVWGISERATSRAVSACVRRLRPKIEIESRSSVNLQTVHGVGWVLHVLGDEAPEGLSQTSIPEAPFDPFVGRSEAHAWLLDAVSRGERLLTVTGPGGVGKSRLVVECLQAALFRAPGRPTVAYVNVDEATDPGFWVVDVASALGLSMSRENLPDALRSRLRALGNVLLVLDNLDGSGAEVGPWLSQLLRDCPNVCALTTRRSTLNLRGEIVYRLDGLQPADAARLFCERMMSRGESVPVDDPRAFAVARGLDGLPLALELAAAQASRVGLDVFCEALLQDDDLPRLRSGEVDRLPRHRSLNEVFERSWQLLSVPDQIVLSALTVFAGPFDARWAVVVTGLPRAQLWEALGRLVDCSLVVRKSGKMVISELIARFVRATMPASTQVRARHAEWALATPRAERRRDLIRAAATCADPRLAALCGVQAVQQLLQVGAVSEAIELSNLVLRNDPPVDSRARLEMLKLQAVSLSQPMESAARHADSLLGQEWLQGDFRVEAAALATRVLRGAPQQLAITRLERTLAGVDATPHGQAVGLRTLAGRYADEGTRPRALELLEQAISLSSEHGLVGDEAWCRLLRANMVGRVDAAEEALDWAQSRSYAGVDPKNRMELARVGASVAWIAGRVDVAIQRAKASVDLAHQLGRPRAHRDGLVLLGGIYAEQGVPELATGVLDAALALGLPDYLWWLARLRTAICVSDLDGMHSALGGLEPFEAPGNALHRRTWIVEGRVEHALLMGRGRDALAYAERAERMAQHMPAQDRVTTAALVSRSLAEVGRAEAALQIAERATERAREFRLPFDLIQAWLAYGEACVLVADRGGLKKSIGMCQPLVTRMRITPESIHARRLTALVRAAHGP
ncbi:MAG: winged helix-turn-helix domain-containing protein [Myxococcota bacterium]